MVTFICGPRGPDGSEARWLRRMLQGIAKTVLASFDAGEFDVAKIFYSEFGSIVNQDPNSTAGYPCEVRSG